MILKKKRNEIIKAVNESMRNHPEDWEFINTKTKEAGIRHSSDIIVNFKEKIIEYKKYSSANNTYLELSLGFFELWKIKRSIKYVINYRDSKSLDIFLSKITKHDVL